MTLVAQQGGAFPLLNMLRAVPATKTAADFDWYDKTTIPGIDREKVGAISLSVCSGEPRSIFRERRDEEPISIDLGPYEEELRQYLLGQTGFPANVTLHVVVCTDALSQDMFYARARGRKKDDTTYTFQARGLNFLMTVGKRIPRDYDTPFLYRNWTGSMDYFAELRRQGTAG